MGSLPTLAELPLGTFDRTAEDVRRDMEAHVARGRAFLLPSSRPYAKSKYREGKDEDEEDRVRRAHEWGWRAQRAADKHQALVAATERQSFAERLAAHRARKEGARA